MGWLYHWNRVGHTCWNGTNFAQSKLCAIRYDPLPKCYQEVPAVVQLNLKFDLVHCWISWGPVTTSCSQVGHEQKYWFDLLTSKRMFPTAGMLPNFYQWVQASVLQLTKKVCQEKSWSVLCSKNILGFCYAKVAGFRFVYMLRCVVAPLMPLRFQSRHHGFWLLHWIPLLCCSVTRSHLGWTIRHAAVGVYW